MASRDGLGKNKKSKLLKDIEGNSARRNRKKPSNRTTADSTFSKVTENVSEENETMNSSTAPIKTLSGGVSLIFSMARRMLLWDDEEYYHQQYNDASPTSDSNLSSTSNVPPLPKWRPYEGIADLNPSFRSEAPVMNNVGYAQTLRRNSRKKGKESLWRYALRIYGKMREIELEQEEQRMIIPRGDNSNHDDEMVGENIDPYRIQRTTEHFEAALVACAKLGLFREAMKIYQEVLDKVAAKRAKTTMEVEDTVLLTDSLKIKKSKTEVIAAKRKYVDTTRVRVTQNMILSLIKACVRQRSINEDERIHSLDLVRCVLESLTEKHGVTVEATMVNPIAAAYVKLGYLNKASDMMDRLLSSPTKSDINKSYSEDDTSTIVETNHVENQGKSTNEFSFIDPMPLNLSDINSKDQASYNILIEAALAKGDYSLAVKQLREMIRNGYYPNSRSLNTWNHS